MKSFCSHLLQMAADMPQSEGAVLAPGHKTVAVVPRPGLPPAAADDGTGVAQKVVHRR